MREVKATRREGEKASFYVAMMETKKGSFGFEFMIGKRGLRLKEGRKSNQMDTVCVERERRKGMEIEKQK